MARKIVIDNSNGEVRAAVIEDGKLADLFLDRSRHPSVLGNIYKGKVENVLPGMQAAFVDIGLEKNAFLYVDDAAASLPDIVKSTRNGDEVELPKARGKSIKDLLKPGQEVLVQVTKEAIGTKGARVVTDVTLAGRYVVLIPSVNYVGVSRKISDDGVRDRLRDLAHKVKPRGMGLIVRTVAEEQSEEEVIRDIEFLTRAWKKIKAKSARVKAPSMIHYDADLVYRMARDYFGDDVTEFTVNTQGDYSKVSDLLHLEEGEKDPRIRLYADKKPVFEAYGIEEEIWKATRRKVWLNSGGYLIFDTTEALTVIDVNTGKFTGSKDLEDTAFRNNLEAAAELARQIRLRNIGGILIADFIDMESEDHRRRVLEELEKHLTKDKARTSVLGITKLGLIEMTRKKSQQGLVELTHRTCDICDGRGKVISEETLALRAERLIKREAAATDMQALLIGLNPYVAGELSHDSSAAIVELEQQTMRDIFIKADSNLGRDDVKVIAIGSLEEILALVHPVKKSDVIEVTVNRINTDRPEQGIGTYKGMEIHIEDAAPLVGKTVKVKVSRVFKAYAKARVEGQPETRRQYRGIQEEEEEDGLIVEAREPRAHLQARKQEEAAPAEQPAMPQAEAGPEAVLEVKKKRRRRRHRRSSNKPAGAAVLAETPDNGEIAPEETTEPEAEGIAIEAPEAVTSEKAADQAAEPAALPKKRRRRRHRSRKPTSQPTASEGQSAAPVGEEIPVSKAGEDEANPSVPIPVAAIAYNQRPETVPQKPPVAAEKADIDKPVVPASQQEEKKAPSRRGSKPAARKQAAQAPEGISAETARISGGDVKVEPAGKTAKSHQPEQRTEPRTETKPDAAAQAAAEQKPKRRYTRRKKSPAEGSENLTIDTKAGE